MNTDGGVKKSKAGSISKEQSMEVRDGMVKREKSTSSLVAFREAEKSMETSLAALASVLRGDPSAEVLTTAYNIVNGNWTKNLKDLRDVMHERLMALTVERGEDTSSGKKVLTVSYNGNKYLAVRAVSMKKAPTPAKVVALLNEKGIDLKAGCAEVVTYVPDTEAMELLVRTGSITQEEYDATFDVHQTSLKVEKL